MEENSLGAFATGGACAGRTLGEVMAASTLGIRPWPFGLKIVRIEILEWYWDLDRK